MRFNTALSTIAFAPAANAFRAGSTVTNPTGITSTSLQARRLMVPMLRRSRPSMFFPDVDRMFREMDEMMESSFPELSSRPSSSMMLDKYPQAQGLGLRQNLGFDVTQDEQSFKVSMNLGDVEVKDVDLQLDSDGRVLRLKGNKLYEEGGMKVQSSFEKAILLHPNVDTDQISASFDHGVLSIVAPKVVEEEILEEEKKPKKIDIHVADTNSEEVKAALDDGVGASESTERAPTRLAVENMKNDNLKTKQGALDNDTNAKKWPARDFPY